MTRALLPGIRGLAGSLIALALAGCNPVAAVMGDDDENETRVTVVAVGAASLDADDGFRYEVTGKTEFEGLAGLSAIAVGDIVQIEWEAVSGSSTSRRALEIEADGPEDDD